LAEISVLTRLVGKRRIAILIAPIERVVWLDAPQEELESLYHQ
jgi:hypothetical protein